MVLEARVLVARPPLVIAADGPVVFVLWTGVAPEVADVRASLPALLDHVRRSKTGAGLVVGMHPSTPVPSKEVREAIQTEMAKLDPLLLCVATVVSKEGFAGSAMRAMLSTLQLLVRPKHPVKVFATAFEAASFVSLELRRAGIEVSAREIQDAHERLSKAHAAG